ncbi:MAG: hypothetical protein KIT73_12465 [Burkholderiales bacterium]|nr:hypothetical protein [Burkholderiales bacterium]
MKRCRVAISMLRTWAAVSALLVLVLASPNVGAIVLSPAFGAVTCYPFTRDDGSLGYSNSHLISASRDLSCAHAAEGSPGGSGSASVDFMSGFVRASGGGTISTHAWIVFEFAVTPSIAPPLQPGIIPVTLDVSYSLGAIGLANSTAALYSLKLRPPGDPGDSAGYSSSRIFQRFAGGAFYPTIAGTGQIDMLVGENEPRILRKEALCLSTGAGSGCATNFDPVVSFDQERFDALMGEDTFPLEAYYRIEYSANFRNPIPEPAAGWLLAAGVMLLAGRGALCRKRRRAKSRDRHIL